MFREIVRLPEFERDLKKLGKRFRMLKEDLNFFIRNQLILYHKLKIDNRVIFLIANLKIDNPKVYKVKKFACRSLRGKGAHSGIRIIYAYFEEQDKIELVEIYYKGDKENEDRQRILAHYRKNLGI